MMKNQFIESLSEGDQLDDLFLIKSARLAETRAGKPYLSLVLADKTGEISGPAWDNAEAFERICTVGSVVKVRGVVQTFRDSLQVRIDQVQAVDAGTYDLEAFVAASPRDHSDMQQELSRLVNSLQNPFLKKLLKTIFMGDGSGELFRTAPAAKGIHHAYLGGLLEHSLSMAQVASLLAGHYSGIDRDLLVAGALLHDIGKTEELLNDAGVIDYTDIGRLKGHLVIGCELIGRAARSIRDFPEMLLTQLQHIVLSHHGRQEFGSPVVPMTAEALLLSFIDDLDAKMNLVEQLRRKLKSAAPQWSDYQRSLERYLYLRPLENQASEAGLDEQSAAAKKQQSLF